MSALGSQKKTDTRKERQIADSRYYQATDYHLCSNEYGC